MDNRIFIRLDGDNIGDKIELFLLENDWDAAQRVHNKVQEGVKDLVKYIQNIQSANLLMVGCDDIFFSVERHMFNKAMVKDLQQKFFLSTQFTLSIGVGDSPLDAINNLRKAKLSGKNKIV